VLWGDGGGGAWFDTKLWDETGDDKAAGGRIVRVMDANGNGKLDQGWVDAKAPLDPTKDQALDPGQAYSVIPNPLDGSVWISYSNIPGGLMRYDPKTKLSEWYETPYMNSKAKVEGYLPHGIDIDRSTGVIWTGLNSGHYAEFDRRKCTGPLNGPTATGQHCPEGWTLHQAPGPQFKTVEESGSADSYYLNWVDWYNTSGLGWCCGCHIRLVSTRVAWTGASTIPRPAGRAVGSGRRTRHRQRGTKRVARANGPR
jgi:hypothetical protein